MMMRRRMGRRGIVGAAVTTAAVVGTAGAVRHHQQQKWEGQEAEQQAQQQAAYDAGAQAAAAQATAAAPVAPAAPAEDEQMAQLQKLAELHNAGVLTDEEFAAAKAKALGPETPATGYYRERSGRPPRWPGALRGGASRGCGLLGDAARCIPAPISESHGIRRRGRPRARPSVAATNDRSAPPDRRAVGHPGGSLCALAGFDHRPSSRAPPERAVPRLHGRGTDDRRAALVGAPIGEPDRPAPHPLRLSRLGDVVAGGVVAATVRPGGASPRRPPASPCSSRPRLSYWPSPVEVRPVPDVALRDRPGRVLRRLDAPLPPGGWSVVGVRPYLPRERLP